MPEIIIQYKTPKTLKFLKNISKYFDFEISYPKKIAGNVQVINGVTIVKGKGKLNNAEMEEIFTKNNFDAKKLRNRLV